MRYNLIENEKGSLNLLLGYRYMDWDFDDNEVFDDLNLSGVFVGAKFWF